MRLIRAELRKLRRPALFVAAILFALFLVRFTLTLANDASSSARVLATGTTQPTGGSEPSRIDPVTLTHLRRAVIEAHDDLSPAGAWYFIAGFAASVPGLLVVVILGALHVAGEWSLRTAGSLFIAEPRPSRVCLSKSATLALAVLPAALVGVGTTVLVGWTRSIDGVAGKGSGALLVSGLARVGRAIPVVVLFAASILLASVIIRNVMGAVAAALGFWAVNALVLSSIVPKFSLMYWVAAWMKFRPAESITQDHVWQDTFGSVTASANQWLALVVVTSVAIAAIALARWSLASSRELA